jgi:hypothetical protein
MALPRPQNLACEMLSIYTPGACHALPWSSRGAQRLIHLAVQPAREPGVALSVKFEDVSNFFHPNKNVFSFQLNYDVFLLFFRLNKAFLH